jgi:cell division protein ZipA
LAELRWILLGLNLVLLAGIWWWGVRQSRQAPGNAELRESPTGAAAAHLPATAHLPTTPHLPAAAPAQSEPREERAPDVQQHGWGVPPFEPLSIRTTDSGRVPALDRPMTANAEALDLGGDSRAPFSPAPAAAAPSPGSGEPQRIVTVRVCAVGEARWSGMDLMAALEVHGLSFGRYQVFHRNHVDGRSMFCVASLVEPGTFDLGKMREEQFRGVTLFAVLPGPIEPVQTLDALFTTARGLAERLSGMVQDAKGIPFSPQRAAALREDVARFQASLPV